jgi:hypothetical protein
MGVVFLNRETENIAPVLLAACIARCIATVAARTAENTAPVLLVACVLLALPNNENMRHSINKSHFMHEV